MHVHVHVHVHVHAHVHAHVHVVHVHAHVHVNVVHVHVHVHVQVHVHVHGACAWYVCLVLEEGQVHESLREAGQFRAVRARGGRGDRGDGGGGGAALAGLGALLLLRHGKRRLRERSRLREEDVRVLEEGLEREVAPWEVISPWP